MKLRILVPLAGATFTLAAGDITDASDAIAERLIAAGYAEPVVEVEEIETATTPSTVIEQAVVKTTKPRITKTK